MAQIYRVPSQLEEQPMSTGYPFPYDPAEGVPLPAVIVSPHQAVGAVSVRQLLDLVPDPIASEKAERVAEDPTLHEYADLRSEVQRMVEGAKARNARHYAAYIVDGLTGRRPRWITPPITLFHREPLKEIEFPGGLRALLVPFSDFLVAIDGETQRIAWQIAAREYPPALQHKVPVAIHHGLSIADAKQSFYDLNTREVKPNAAVAITMDTLDVATRITRAVMDASEVIRGRVHLRRRQLRKSDSDYLLTISAIRTGVVTSILGSAGLQVGSRPIALPEDVDVEAVEAAVIEVWTAIFEALEDELGRRLETVVSAPAILAGIGVVAHHTMPSPPRKAEVTEWTVEEVVSHLESVRWDRELPGTGGPRHPWDGIAGKVTPSGNFSIGGPKEVGYAVAQALEDPASDYGRQVRA